MSPKSNDNKLRDRVSVTGDEIDDILNNLFYQKDTVMDA